MQDTVFVKIIVLIKTALKYRQKELLDRSNNVADIRYAYQTQVMLWKQRTVVIWRRGTWLKRMLFGGSPKPFPSYPP
jgi:hypothetical protein